MTCHKYEAALWLFNNPQKTNNIKNEKNKQKKKKANRKNAGVRPTCGLPPLYFRTRRDQQLFLGSVMQPCSHKGLHVSTTAEPHRTVMRGVEEGGWVGGAGVVAGLVKNYSEQHRSRRLHKQRRDNWGSQRRERKRETKRNRGGDCEKGFFTTNTQEHTRRSLKKTNKKN